MIKLTSIVLLLLAVPASAQVIDFETLPDGTPTVDQQEIAAEYALYGVTFTLLDRATGLPIGSPRIAKAGPPLTAFEGCFADDTPRPHLDLGVSFLTDGTQLGVEGDVRIEYAAPVGVASGVILDVDCRTNGGPPCEQWTITAFDSLGVAVGAAVIDGPPGAPNPECSQPEAGPGDSEAFGWVIDAGAPRISSILLQYTGVATGVGLAFDAFSVASAPGPLSVEAACAADSVCTGESVLLTAVVQGGLPPYAFQWQQQIDSGIWIDLGTGYSQEVHPMATTRYRVGVTDATGLPAVSDPLTLTVLEDDPLCLAELLVSSFDNDRLIRYSFRSSLPAILVPSGSGGLNGPSKLICGPDSRVYVSSQYDDRVLRFDGATGAFVDIFVAAGSGGLDVPVGLDFGPDGNLYVVSNANNSVLRYDGSTGAFLNTFVPSGSGLSSPTGMVFGPDDNLYVCSNTGDKVVRFSGWTGAPLGDFVPAGSGGLDAPRGLTFGPDGNLYVAEQYHDSVRRYDGSTGAFIDVFIPPGSGGLDRANDVLFGLDGSCYVASYDGNRVLRYDGASGAFLGELAPDFLSGPAWLAVGCPRAVTRAPDVARPALGLFVEPAAPNPFRPLTRVTFVLPDPGHVQVSVLDAAGRRVATLADGPFDAGPHEVPWNGTREDGRAAPAGVYYITLTYGPSRAAAKVVLLR